MTDDVAPVVGPGGCEPVGGARLDLAGTSEARASGGRGGGAWSSSQFGGKGPEDGDAEADIRARSGRPKTAGKEGARARGGCKPGGPIEHGSRRL